MSSDQLSLFRVGRQKRVVQPQLAPAVVPTGESSILATLPAYRGHLSGKYAAKTVKTYSSDVAELGLYLRGRKLEGITLADLQEWRTSLLSAPGEPRGAKTVARKVSAVINYFGWLRAIQAVSEDVSLSLINERVQSPLPEYLFDQDIELLYQVASKDARTYMLVLLLLETGMKSSELFQLTTADVDTSDQYRPELWIRHRGRAREKDRKVQLPATFVAVYEEYRAKYRVDEYLFEFSDRFSRKLFAHLKGRSGIRKKLTPTTLRHTHVVQAYRRGEDAEAVFDRIGLAEASRQEAHETYTRLARRGI